MIWRGLDLRKVGYIDIEKWSQATADNIAYLASCLRYFAQIPLRGTSDTLGALYAIVFRYQSENIFMSGNKV